MGKLAGISRRNRAASVCSRSTFTPITTSPRFPYLACISFALGETYCTTGTGRNEGPWLRVEGPFYVLVDCGEQADPVCQ